MILQPIIACSPCPHSSPCSQSTHACAKLLSPEIVSTVAHQYLAGNSMALKELAEEFSSEVRILRTKIASSGFWMAHDIIESKPEKVLETIVDRCTWKFLLNREYLNPLAQFGSEGVQMKRELDEIFPRASKPMITDHLTFLEGEADVIGGKASNLLSSVRLRSPALEDIKEFIENVKPLKSEMPWLEHLTKASEHGLVEIGGLRRVHNQLEHFSQQAQIKVKLIRSLKSQLTESQ